MNKKVWPTECPSCQATELLSSPGMIYGGFGWVIQSPYRCATCGFTWIRGYEKPLTNFEDNLTDEIVDVTEKHKDDKKEYWISLKELARNQIADIQEQIQEQNQRLKEMQEYLNT